MQEEINDNLTQQNIDDGITVFYNYTSQEIKDGLKYFQKKTIYKKNYIYTIILSVLILSNVYEIFNNFENAQYYFFLVFVCVLLLSFVWIVPISHIKNIVKAIDYSNQDAIQNYQIKFYENRVIIGSENISEYYYNDKYLKMWETNESFIVAYDKNSIFVVPKRCCENNVSEISSLINKEY